MRLDADLQEAHIEWMHLVLGLLHKLTSTAITTHDGNFYCAVCHWRSNIVWRPDIEYYVIDVFHSAECAIQRLTIQGEILLAKKQTKKPTKKQTKKPTKKPVGKGG